MQDGLSRFSGFKYGLQLIAIIGVAAAPFAQPVVAQSSQAARRLFTFPAKANGFERRSNEESKLTDIFARADYVKSVEGQDISVKVDVIHLLEMSPIVHFAIRKSNLIAEYPELQLVAEGEYQMKGMPPRSGYFGRFKDIRNGETQSFGVWTFDLGAWDVHVKARYPAGSKAQAEKDIRKLLENMDWELLQNMRPSDKID